MSSILRAENFVPRVLKNFMATSGLEPTCLRIVAAGPGKVTFDLHIHKQHTNRLNILHGGTIASMVDLGGSLAVASMGLYSTGVSTDLNVSYLSAGGKAGDKIRVIAECEKMGKTLAYTHMKFFNSKGDMFARGSHTKFIEKARQDQSTPYALPAWDSGIDDGEKEP
ncbi:thioesterase family [Diaporthe amygdali]|uniref:thioesterase family n=1 Tax=Phomopsis amygdali TaxID=1214568 RepID=UPI0022FDF438|nr:thioesterase family [Diaporthe amygdali]KAJ0119696.1 thioesterase family [Diaporthe amygdali]